MNPMQELSWYLLGTNTNNQKQPTTITNQYSQFSHTRIIINQNGKAQDITLLHWYRLVPVYQGAQAIRTRQNDSQECEGTGSDRHTAHTTGKEKKKGSTRFCLKAAPEKGGLVSDGQVKPRRRGLIAMTGKGGA
jgi:hypothetical protein